MPHAFHKRLEANADKMGLKGEARKKYIYGGLEKDTKTLQKHRRIKMAQADKPTAKYPELKTASKGEGKKFDPEGTGYDYDSAKKAGLKADKTGHWPSRNPKTGQILKGQKHPTYHKTTAGEKKAGYKIRKDPDGKYYSSKAKKKGKDGA